MLQGHNQPNRPHPPERMCKDLRSMQLFAEQVLAYRGSPSAQSCRSYGFHEPNTDEGRQVYTIIDDRIYYFLPRLNPETVHRAFAHLQTLVRDQFGRTPAIQQVVIVGESSTTDDDQRSVGDHRARLQEAVDNYQFTTAPEPTSPPESDSPTAAMVSDRPEVIDNHVQVTMLPSATPKPLPIRPTLSYINEDPYWDPRQDDLGTTRDGILHDRAGTITSWLQQQPHVPTSPTPQFTVPLSSTTLQTPETELQAAAVPPIAAPRAPEPHYEPSPTGLERRNQATAPIDWSLGALANNWWLLLAGIGMLSAVLWWMRGGPNPPAQVGTAGNQLVSPPPPPIDSRPPNQSSTTFNPPQKSTVTSPSPSATVPPRQTTRTAQLPAAGFFVRSPTPYDGVNLRVGPGLDNGKIRAVPNGYWLVDEGRQIGIWREVSFQGQRGWVYRPFVR
jgi:hypothetical protein